MMLLFCIVGTMAYFITGAGYSRSRYAKSKYSISLIDNLEWAKNAVGASHGANCNLHYTSLRKRGCDCARRADWNKAKDIVALSEEYKKSPTAMMAFWPWYMMIDFLTGGTYKPNYNDPLLVARLEKEVGIGENYVGR